MRRNLRHSTCTLALLASFTAQAQAAQVDVRVLLIATGTPETDQARRVMEDLFNSLGVAYETLDSSVQPLTDSVLYSDPSHGRFNGVILTDAETYLPDGGVGLTVEEFDRLHDYESTLGVREAIMSGFPASSQSADYGMGAIGATFDASGLWTTAAGTTDQFEYINTANPLPVEGFAFLAQSRNDPWEGPLVEPILVDEQNPEYTLISRLRYPNGREVLLSTMSQAWWFLHSHVLGYEFLNFATSGLFIGERKAYLAAHNDDLFLPDEVWNPETLSNFPEEELNFRLSAEEVVAAVESQARFHNAHPLASTLVTDWAFNGVGADPVLDPLSQAISAHAADFGFINHTFEALQMDRLCPEDGGGGECIRTDYTTALNEIQRNAEVWNDLDLPYPERALMALLSDSHSGLSDRLGTESTADDIPFPEGFNDDFGWAAEALGIRTLAGDASRLNQDKIQRIPGHELVLLPRYPTGVYYNTITPEQLVSEYNYIHNQRYLEQGEDPCEIPSAICIPRSYPEILESEATTTLRHILSYEPYPHYFHQVNLHVYDEAGSSLQFDWLDSVLSAYEQLVTLPLVNLRFHQLGELAWRRVRAQETPHDAVLDTETGSVTVRASNTVDLSITGLAGGELYGGQRILQVVATPTATTYAVDLAQTE